MTTKFYFDFRDIFRAGRLGFKGKKMMMHFLGLMLGYLIYESLTYLSLVSSGAGKFWAAYGLRPVCPFESAVELSPATIIMMAVGAFIWVIIYYLFSTAVSKVAVEELRGDDFYSMKAALGFACKRWKSIFITMVALVGIFIFCLFFPSMVGLLDLIPGVEQAAEHFAAPMTTFLTIPIYFMGLFMVLVILALLFGLLLIPAIVAVTGEDVFETIYELFSTIWNQPWRLIIYGKLLIFVKSLGSAVFAAASIAGLYIAFLPSVLLANQETHYFADLMARSLRIVGVNPEMIERIIPNVSSLHPSMPWTLDVATFFLFGSFIMIAAIILSYPLSIMSSGYTILYVILRKKNTDENMLEVEEEEEIGMSAAEEPKEPEKTEESAAEEPAEESEEDSEQE